MPRSLKYTVIGAGNGGKAMAAHLALMGKEVTLYNRTESRIEDIKELGSIRLESYEGGPHGIGQIKLVTSDMGEALEKADMVMVVVPASAHASIALKAAPHLHDGQVVILHPGRTGGALEFTKVLRDSNCSAAVKVAEADLKVQPKPGYFE